MTKQTMNLAERMVHFGKHFATRYETECDAEDVRLADSLLLLGFFHHEHGFWPVELRYIHQAIGDRSRPRFNHSTRVHADGQDLIEARRLAYIEYHQLPRESWSAEKHGCCGRALQGDERSVGLERCGRECVAGRYLCRVHLAERMSNNDAEIDRCMDNLRRAIVAARTCQAFAEPDGHRTSHDVPIGTRRRS